MGSEDPAAEGASARDDDSLATPGSGRKRKRGFPWGKHPELEALVKRFKQSNPSLRGGSGAAGGLKAFQALVTAENSRRQSEGLQLIEFPAEISERVFKTKYQSTQASRARYDINSGSPVVSAGRVGAAIGAGGSSQQQPLLPSQQQQQQLQQAFDGFESVIVDFPEVDEPGKQHAQQRHARRKGRPGQLGSIVGSDSRGGDAVEGGVESADEAGNALMELVESKTSVKRLLDNHMKVMEMYPFLQALVYYEFPDGHNFLDTRGFLFSSPEIREQILKGFLGIRQNGLVKLATGELQLPREAPPAPHRKKGRPDAFGAFALYRNAPQNKERWNLELANGAVSDTKSKLAAVSKVASNAWKAEPPSVRDMWVEKARQAGMANAAARTSSAGVAADSEGTTSGAPSQAGRIRLAHNGATSRLANSQEMAAVLPGQADTSLLGAASLHMEPAVAAAAATAPACYDALLQPRPSTAMEAALFNMAGSTPVVDQPGRQQQPSRQLQQPSSQQQRPAAPQPRQQATAGDTSSASSVLGGRYACLQPFLAELQPLRGLEELEGLLHSGLAINILHSDPPLQLALTWLCQSVSMCSPARGSIDSIFLNGALRSKWREAEVPVLQAWLQLYAAVVPRQRNKEALVSAILKELGNPDREQHQRNVVYDRATLLIRQAAQQARLQRTAPAGSRAASAIAGGGLLPAGTAGAMPAVLGTNTGTISVQEQQQKQQQQQQVSAFVDIAPTSAGSGVPAVGCSLHAIPGAMSYAGVAAPAVSAAQPLPQQHEHQHGHSLAVAGVPGMAADADLAAALAAVTPTMPAASDFAPFPASSSSIAALASQFLPHMPMLQLPLPFPPMPMPDRNAAAASAVQDMPQP